jgi:hypothetical protein
LTLICTIYFVQAVLDTVLSLGVSEVALVSNALTGLLQLSRLVEDLQSRRIQVAKVLAYLIPEHLIPVTNDPCNV